MAQRVVSAEPNRSIEARSGLAAPTALGAGATLGAGMLIAFACAPGKGALDGGGANTPLSAALSGTPGLEARQTLTPVRAEVVAANKSNQVPWSGSSLLGGVYLAAKLAASSPQRAHNRSRCSIETRKIRSGPNGEGMPSIVKALVGLEAHAISGSDPAKQWGKRLKE
jgi:hypothetical protein